MSSSTHVIDGDEVRVGDTVNITRVSRFTHGVIKESRRICEGVVERLNTGESAAYLRPPSGGSGEWVALQPTDRTTVVIKRIRRHYETGEMYRVHLPSENKDIVRIWVRREDGWMTTSGYRDDAQFEGCGWVIGECVLLQPQ